MNEHLLRYWPVLVVMVSLVSAWVSWAVRKEYVSHGVLDAAKAGFISRVGGVETKVIALEQDMAIVKNRLDALPTKDDLHRIEVAVTTVAGDLKAVGANQMGLVRNIHLLMRERIEEE